MFCAHGANSTNALYMRSNTHFLESFGDKYINPCMFDIIKRNKIHYHMLVGKTNNKSVGYTSDYPVSIEHLDCILYNLV